MKKTSLWLLSLPLLFLASSLLSQSYSLLNWVNLLFFLGLILLVIGCLMLIIAGDFFTPFVHNWKKFFSTLSKKDQLINSIEGKTDQEITRYSKVFPSSKILILIGLGYSLVSIALSIFLTF